MVAAALDVVVGSAIVDSPTRWRPKENSAMVLPMTPCETMLFVSVSTAMRPCEVNVYAMFIQKLQRILK